MMPQTIQEKLHHLIYGLIAALVTNVATFASIWPNSHGKALLVLFLLCSPILAYETEVVYGVKKLYSGLFLGTFAASCLAAYLLVGPTARLTPEIGWLQPGSDVAPPNPCDGLLDNPSRILVILGDDAFVTDRSGRFIPLQVGACDLISIKIDPDGALIRATIYSATGKLLGTIIDNKYIIAADEHLLIERSGDLHTLVVHDNQGRELLNVRYVNPTAFQVKGEFTCPTRNIGLQKFPGVETVTVKYKEIEGVNIHKSCVANSKIGLQVH